MFRSFRLSSAALAALLIVGCGGSDSPPATFDIAAAVTGIAKANEAYTLKGSISGAAATLEVTHSALPDAPLASFGTLNAFRRSVTISAAGTVVSASEDDYLDLATRTFYGLIDSEGNRALSTTRAPYPATATIGNSGLLYDATSYDQSSAPVGKAHVSWSLEAVPGNAGVAYLCVNMEFQDLSGASSGVREHDCYGIATNGARLGMRVTIVTPSGTLVFE
jgi:hypothetical protein